MNDSKHLLVVRYPMPLSHQQAMALYNAMEPTADELGAELLVLDNGADATIERSYEALLTRLCVAVEALVAQGVEEPNVAQIAPQALNARQTGLNSRPAATHTAGCAEVSGEGTTLLQKGERVVPRG